MAAGDQLESVQPGRQQVALGCWTSECQARPIKWNWPDSQAETHWALVAFSSSIHILRHRTCKSTRKSTCRMLGCPRQSPSSLGRVAPAAACQPIRPSLSPSLMDSPFAQRADAGKGWMLAVMKVPVRQSDTRSSASQSVSFVILSFSPTPRSVQDSARCRHGCGSGCGYGFCSALPLHEPHPCGRHGLNCFL